MPRRTYTVSGPLTVAGAGLGVAVAALLVNLALAAWFIYLIVKIAGYVNAWPF